MAELWFDWPEPALPDLLDVGEDYTLAVQFEVGGAVPGVGVRWRVPDTAPTGTCAAAIWRVSDQALLAAVDFVVDPGAAGAPLGIYFETAPTLVTLTAYRASIYTPNRYCATTNYPWPATEEILTAGAQNGWLETAAQFPSVPSGNSANFHVSPIVQVEDNPAGAGPRLVLSTPTGRLAAGTTAGRITTSTPRGRL